MTAVLDETTLRAAMATAEGEALVLDMAMELDATPDGIWSLLGRPAQQEPQGSWLVWLILAGRGFGKTRTLAETLHRRVRRGQVRRTAVVAATAADVRDVIVEGESGILATAPGGWRPLYEPSKRRLTWPNGAIAHLYSADEPDRLRGPQHDFALCDELAAWRYPEAWDMLLLGLRLGDDPRVAVATTPRPTRLIRDLVAGKDSRSGRAIRCHVTRGSTYDNLANLAPSFREAVLAQYEGTRLGRQELFAEILDDVPGALWSATLLEKSRGEEPQDRRLAADKSDWIVFPARKRTAVGVDPATTSGEDADETGIAVAALGSDGLGYVLADRSVKQASPDEWGRAACQAAIDFSADCFTVETNQGGEMCAHVLQTAWTAMQREGTAKGLMPRVVRIHAKESKRLRAEPVAALYEQGRIKHVGAFPLLEEQMTGWTPDSGSSPDRLDAVVHALTELMVGVQPTRMRFVA